MNSQKNKAEILPLNRSKNRKYAKACKKEWYDPTSKCDAGIQGCTIKGDMTVSDSILSSTSHQAIRKRKANENITPRKTNNRRIKCKSTIIQEPDAVNRLDRVSDLGSIDTFETESYSAVKMSPSNTRTVKKNNTSELCNENILSVSDSYDPISKCDAGIQSCTIKGDMTVSDSILSSTSHKAIRKRKANENITPRKTKSRRIKCKSTIIQEPDAVNSLLDRVSDLGSIDTFETESYSTVKMSPSNSRTVKKNNTPELCSENISSVSDSKLHQLSFSVQSKSPVAHIPLISKVPNSDMSVISVENNLDIEETSMPYSTSAPENVLSELGINDDMIPRSSTNFENVNSVVESLNSSSDFELFLHSFTNDNEQSIVKTSLDCNSINPIEVDIISLLVSKLNEVKDSKENFICNQLKIKPVIKYEKFNYDDSNAFNIAFDVSTLKAANDYIKEKLAGSDDIPSLSSDVILENSDTWQNSLVTSNGFTPDVVNFISGDSNELNPEKVTSTICVNSYNENLSHDLDNCSQRNLNNVENFILSQDLNIDSHEINNENSQNLCEGVDLLTEDNIEKTDKLCATVKRRKKKITWNNRKRGHENKISSPPKVNGLLNDISYYDETEVGENVHIVSADADESVDLNSACSPAQSLTPNTKLNTVTENADSGNHNTIKAKDQKITCRTKAKCMDAAKNLNTFTKGNLECISENPSNLNNVENFILSQDLNVDSHEINNENSQNLYEGVNLLIEDNIEITDKLCATVKRRKKKMNWNNRKRRHENKISSPPKVNGLLNEMSHYDETKIVENVHIVSADVDESVDLNSASSSAQSLIKKTKLNTVTENADSGNHNTIKAKDPKITCMIKAKCMDAAKYTKDNLEYISENPDKDALSFDKCDETKQCSKDQAKHCLLENSTDTGACDKISCYNSSQLSVDCDAPYSDEKCINPKLLSKKSDNLEINKTNLRTKCNISYEEEKNSAKLGLTAEGKEFKFLIVGLQKLDNDTLNKYCAASNIQYPSIQHDNNQIAVDVGTTEISYSNSDNTLVSSDGLEKEVELHSSKEVYKKNNLDLEEHLTSPKKSKPLQKSKREKNRYKEFEVCKTSKQKLKFKFKIKNAHEKLNKSLTGIEKNTLEALESKNEEAICDIEINNNNSDKQFKTIDLSDTKVLSSQEKLNYESKQKLPNESVSISKAKNLIGVSELNKLPEKHSKSDDLSNTAIAECGDNLSDVTDKQNIACSKLKKGGKCTSELNKRPKRNLRTNSANKDIPLHEKDQEMISHKQKLQHIELDDLEENSLQNNFSKPNTVSPGEQADISFENNASVFESIADANVSSERQSNIHQQTNMKTGSISKKSIAARRKKIVVVSSDSEILSSSKRLNTESEQKLSNETANISKEKNVTEVSELDKNLEKHSKSDDLSDTAITVCGDESSSVTDKQNIPCLKSKKRGKCTSDLELNKCSKRNLRINSGNKNIPMQEKDQEMISHKQKLQHKELDDLDENSLQNNFSKPNTVSPGEQADISFENNASVFESIADANVSSERQSNIHQQTNMKTGSTSKKSIAARRKKIVVVSSDSEILSSSKRLNTESEQKLSNETANISKEKNVTEVSELDKNLEKHSKSDDLSDTAITVCGDESSSVTDKQNIPCLKSKKRGKFTSDLELNKCSKRNLRINSGNKNIPMHEKDQELISPKQKLQHIELDDLVENPLQNNSSKPKTVSPGEQANISFENNVSVLVSDAGTSVSSDMESNIHQQNNIKTGSTSKSTVTALKEETVILSDKKTQSFDDCLAYTVVNENKKKKKNNKVSPKKSKEFKPSKNVGNVSKMKVSRKQVNESSKSLPDSMTFSDTDEEESNCKIKGSNKISRNVQNSLEKSINKLDSRITSPKSCHSNSISEDLHEKNFNMCITDSDLRNENIVKVKSMPRIPKLSDKKKKEKSAPDINHSKDFKEPLFKSPYAKLTKSINKLDSRITSPKSCNSNSISEDLHEKKFNICITDSDLGNENIIKVKSMAPIPKLSDKKKTEKSASDINRSKDFKDPLFKSPYAKLTVPNSFKVQGSTSQTSYFEDDALSLKSIGKTSTVILMNDEYLDFEPDQSDVGSVCNNESSCSTTDEIDEALVAEPDLSSLEITNFEELESSITLKDNAIEEPDSILPTNHCRTFTNPYHPIFEYNSSAFAGKDLITEEDTDSEDDHSFKRTRSERKVNDGNETSLNYVDLNNWKESDIVQNEVFQKQSEQSAVNSSVSSLESESLKSSCEDQATSLNNDQINSIKSKEPAGSVAHLTDVLSQIQALCFKGLFNEALEIINTYFAISPRDINQFMLRNFLVSTFSFISKLDKVDNSFANVFEEILKLMHHFTICNKKIASYFITKCCLYPDLNIYSVKIFHMCHKGNIPLDTKAVKALSHLFSESALTLSEEIPFSLMLDFMNYTKLICKKNICKEVLHLALKKCETLDLPFSDIHHICSLLHGITSKEVEEQNLKDFICLIFKKMMWQHVAEMFIAWGTKNCLSICIYTALTTDYKTMGEYFQKFANYVHEKEGSLCPELKDSLTPQLKARFGQMGTALMLNAFSKNAMDIALDILYILHTYNVNYFELQLSMSRFLLTESNLEAENCSCKIFPFSVVFTAVDICLHFNRPIDAFTIFQGYSWVVPDESLDDAAKMYIIKEKYQRLLKLVSLLNNEDSLDKGFEPLQNLLTLVKQDFAYEILKEKVCDLVSLYNEYLVSLMNAEKLSSVYILYEYSLGPRKDIFTILPDVLRGLIVTFSEDGRDSVVNNLFILGIMKKIYPLQKPKLEHFPWEITLVTHWTITEIKLAVEWFIQDLFSILMEKPKETHFENWFSVKIVFDIKDQSSEDLKCLKDTISEPKHYITKTKTALEDMNPSLEVTDDLNENALYIKSNSLYNFWKSRCPDQVLKFINVDMQFLKVNDTFFFGSKRRHSRERESSVFVKTLLNETCSLSKSSDKMIEPQNSIQSLQSPSSSNWKNTSATDVYEMIHEIKAKTPPISYVATTPEHSPSGQNSVHNIPQPERFWFSDPMLGRTEQIEEFQYSPQSPTISPNQLTESNCTFTSKSQSATFSDVNQSITNNDTTNNSSHFQSPFSPCSSNRSPRTSNALSNSPASELLSKNSGEKNESKISILKTPVATSQPLVSCKKVSLLRSRTISVNKTPARVKKVTPIRKGKILKANNSNNKFQNFKVCITPRDRTVSSPSIQNSPVELQSVRSNLEESIITNNQEKSCPSFNEDMPVSNTSRNQTLPVISKTTHSDAKIVAINFTGAGSSTLLSRKVSDSHATLVKLPVTTDKGHKQESDELPVSSQTTLKSTKSPVQCVTSSPKSKFVKNISNDKSSNVSITTSLQNCKKDQSKSKPVINRNSSYSSISKTPASVTSSDKISSIASGSGKTVMKIDRNEKTAGRRQNFDGNEVFPVIGSLTWNEEESKKVTQFLKAKVAFKYKDLSPIDQNKKVLSLFQAFIKSNGGITKLDKRTMKLLTEFANDRV